MKELHSNHSEKADVLNLREDRTSSLFLGSNDMRDMYGDYTKFLEKKNEGPYYHYTKEQSTIPLESQPAILPEYIETFYAKAEPSRKKFMRAQEILYTIGMKKGEKITSAKGKETAKIILENSYELVKAYNDFLNSPVSTNSSEDSDIFLRPFQRVQLSVLGKELGKEKPEAVKETLRRYIPRWLTHPLTVPNQTDSETSQSWMPFSVQEAQHLISPEQMDEGKAPLMIALKTAEEEEAEGNKEYAYDLRTQSILTLLEVEKKRSEMSQNAEVPFFTYIVGGVLTSADPHASKHAHFDYASTISETMRQTYQRLQEDSSEKTSKATNFLNNLAEYYPDSLPELLAQSINNADRKYEEVDVIEIIKNLEEQESNWARETTSKIEEAFDRRVLRNNEISELAESLPAIPEGGIMDAEDFIKDASVVLGEADLFMFNHKLPKIENEKNTPSYEIGIELDRMSETIAAKIHVIDAIGERYLPLQLSFSGEAESLQVETLDNQSLENQQIDSLRSVVADIIHYHAEKIRSKREGKKQHDKGIDEKEQATPLEIQTLSRSERIALYQCQKDATEKKRRGKIIQDVSEVSVESPSASTLSEARTVTNLTDKNVQKMLDDQKIQTISAEELTGKINRMIMYADIGRKMLGKRVNVHSTGVEVGDINLRQINLLTHGGSNALRVYLEDVGKGEFVLQGILLKKGENQQQRYIKNLITKILKEKAAKE